MDLFISFLTGILENFFQMTNVILKTKPLNRLLTLSCVSQNEAIIHVWKMEMISKMVVGICAGFPQEFGNYVWRPDFLTFHVWFGHFTV